LILSVSLII